MVNAICLTSGGIESSTLAYYLKKKLKVKKLLLLFFDYGQKAREQEEFCARRISKDLKCDFQKIEIPWLGQLSTSFINKQGKAPETKQEDLENLSKGDEDILNWWVPCRNALFLTIGLAHAESFFLKKKEKYNVYLGIKKEVYAAMKDNTPEFLEAMNGIVEHATHHGDYALEAPLLKYEKEEVVKLGKELKVPYQFTYSCYLGAGFEKEMPVHCGKCAACKLRQYAFQWSLIKDPSSYRNL